MKSDFPAEAIERAREKNVLDREQHAQTPKDENSPGESVNCKCTSKWLKFGEPEWWWQEMR